tara:strand:- start:787 stop:1194 length:408 start_codon:yes stop_codon:yes gene_type:complete
MLDYMSNFPPPSREDSLNEIKREIKKYPQFKSISDKYIEKEISKNFDLITSRDARIYRGSAAGWVTFEKAEIIKKTKHCINIFNYKKYRFRAILKSLVLINKIYFDSIEKRYAPGGKGMIEAQSQFEELKLCTKT